MITAAPPGPRGLPFLGNALHFRRDPLGFLTRAARDHGDLVRLTAGRQELVFINHPDLLESVLATNARKFTRSKSRPPTRLDYFLAGGEYVYRVINFPGDEDFWVRERHRFNPSLKRSALARYGPTMVRMAERHASTWRDGEVREVHREMLRITLDIVLNALYGVDFPGDREHILDTCETIVRDITHRATHPFQAPPIVPTRENRKLRQAVGAGRKLVERILREQPEGADGGGAGAGNLIAALRRAGDREAGLLENPEWQYQIIALLIAGHETTAVALTWTWYLLAQHPSVAQRLYAEVDAVLGGRAPGKDDAAALTWCDAVFKEALRLYPPVPIIPRMAYTELTLGGYRVAPGTVLLICPWVTHRDERFFAAAERFQPRRWLDGPEPRRYSYLPFSGGPRTCIGQSFATAEAILAIARIAQQYRLELAAGEPPRPAPWVGLRPHNGLPMRVTARARPGAPAADHGPGCPQAAVRARPGAPADAGARAGATGRA